MLVLNRFPNETVILTLPDGRRGRVVVIGVGARARLGFELPPDVTIHREEVQAELDADAARRRGAAS